MAATPNQPLNRADWAATIGSTRTRSPPVRRRKVAGKVCFRCALLARRHHRLARRRSCSSTPSICPRFNDLERYRPSTTTDLYDRKGRIIGSFALERRVVVNYDDFAPVLRQAVISIEDKSFESHWGINVLRIAGAVVARSAQPRPRPGRLHAHHATGAQSLSLLRAHRRPQTAGSLSRHPDRARLHQAADLHPLRQPDLSRQRHVRL